MGDSPVYFKMRKRGHSERTYTEKDILNRIAQGRYSGDEEVAAPPYSRWQKLSSHPRFYDAFMKNIFLGKYNPSDSDKAQSDEPANALDEKLENGTHQEPKEEQACVPDDELQDDAKTRQIAADRALSKIDPALVNELFSEDGEEEKSGSALERPVFENSPDQNRSSPEALKRPLDFGAHVTAEESPETIARKKQQERKRRLAIVGGAAIVLSLLFVFGSGEPKSDNPKTVGDKPADTLSSLKLEERAQGLIDEGQRLIRYDSIPFYAGAVDAFSRAQFLQSADRTKLAGSIAEALIRAVDFSSGAELNALINRVESVIKEGRKTDPHASSFYRAEAILFQNHYKKMAEAKKAIDYAHEAEPLNPQNKVVLGEYLELTGDLQDATRSLIEAIALDPSSVRAHAALARIAFRSENFQDARRYADTALKFNPLHVPSYLILAGIARAKNQFKEARGLYEYAARLGRFASHQDAGSAYFSLATLQELSGAKAEAEKNYWRAFYFLKTDQVKDKVARLSNPKEWAPKARSKEEGVETLVLDHLFSGKDLIAQGERLGKGGTYGPALALFAGAVMLNPKDGRGLYQMGLTLEKMAEAHDQIRQAMLVYEDAIRNDPAVIGPYIRLGLIENDNFNFDTSLKLLSNAASIQPDAPEVFLALAKHFLKRQDFAEAKANLAKAYKLNPTISETLFLMGQYLVQTRQEEATKEAMAYFYRAYALNPLNHDAMLEWLRMKVLGQEKRFAVKFVRNLIQLEPGNSVLYWILGELYSTDKEFHRAIEQYHKALDLDARSGKVRMSLAKALEAVGATEKASAEYWAASNTDRKNPEGYYRAAELLLQLLNPVRADEALKELINVYPNYPGAYRLMARVAFLRQQKDSAIAFMQKEISNHPRNAKFRLELAELYVAYKDFEKATGELSQLLALPNSPDIQGERLGAFLLMSRCFRELQKFENAEGVIRQALLTDPEEPRLHLELGYVYHALDRDKEAVTEFNAYLSRNPAAQDAESIKRLINQISIEE
ncbi:MAG: tetratricopeptide repeat protein [Deltaproteobacteria bacterium]|nr:tetratricopeptide repeat protein [Deltaproteobacteria bacterium]